ncbi:MAG: hypothetical protein IPL23_06580 [Saprospiraceae bacterium]|nr:hypothetical protein [Saprospiraceae bacterium]
MKSNNRFTRFTLKGFSKIEIEFGLMALGHNLRKAFVKMNKSGNNSPKTAKNTHLNTCKIILWAGWSIICFGSIVKLLQLHNNKNLLYRRKGRPFRQPQKIPKFSKPELGLNWPMLFLAQKPIANFAVQQFRSSAT